VWGVRRKEGRCVGQEEEEEEEEEAIDNRNR
jgi:hypothetical protein